MESNLQWAVNKTSSEKKNTHVLKRILNAVIAGIEALVSGSKFLYTCVKEAVSLAMFWHFLSTPHYCWSAVITTSSSGR
jgi:hypothetical protein